LSSAEPPEPAEGKRSPEAQVAAAGAWGLGARAMLLIANLVATPFTIRLLGPSRYGLWAVLQACLIWASLSEAGMGLASTKFGADRYARGDGGGESAVIWTALSVTAVTTTCMALVIAIGAPFIVGHLLQVSGALLGPGVVGLRIVAGVLVAQSAAAIVNTPQVVRLRWRQYTIITGIASLIAAAGPPIALTAVSGGVVTVTAVLLCAATVGALGSFVLGIRLQPALRRPRIDKAVLRQLLSYGGALTIGGLASIPLLTAERFFLAHNHSTTVVAYYAVAATLATTLNVLPEQLVGPLLPGLVQLEAQGRLDEQRVLYGKSLAALFLCLTPGAIILAFLAHPFLSLWAGPAYGLHSTGPFLVIVAGVWFNCMSWVPYNYLLSCGRTKLIARVQVAEVLPYLAGAWVLTAKFGAMGAALVWSATFVADSIIFFTVVRRVAPQLTFSPLSERRLRAIGAPVLLASVVAAAAILSHGLFTRLGWATVLSLIYAVGVWRLVLTTGERQGLLNLVEEVTARGRRRPAA
jgi:O-antigen/teichoic acid export membrane protein